MNRRNVVYAGVVVFVTVVAMGIGNVAYTNHVDERRRASDRAARAAQQRAGEQVKAGVCAMILANVRVYDETPPSTPAGRNLAESWDLLKVQFGC